MQPNINWKHLLPLHTLCYATVIEWINCTFFYRELYIFVYYFFIFLSDVERYTLLKEDLCCWKWTCLIQNKSNFILGNFDIYIAHSLLGNNKNKISLSLELHCTCTLYVQCNFHPCTVFMIHIRKLHLALQTLFRDF